MNVIRIPSARAERAEIEAQAQTWVVRLDGNCSREELARFGEWLERSPLHRSVFRETATFWCGLDSLSRLLPLAENLRREKRRRGFGLALAAGALSAALALFLLAPSLPFLPAASIDDYSTAVGEIRELTLPDGSVINLNTNSQVSVSYRRNARLVHLSSGEAFFEVAHDPERPFLVYSGKYAVKAVGTAFSVHNGEQALDVIVTDGRIEVSAFDQPVHKAADMTLDLVRRAATLVPLDKGQMGVFNDAGGKLELVAEMDAGSLDRNLSWRDGMLIFDDPLPNAVEVLNRYTPVRLVITDAALRDYQFGGTFRVGDIAAILETLEQTYGIRVDRVAPDLIYLSRAQ